ncbi:MAG: L-aspartate oxidase [Bacillales bacterium]|jgi:L-aspartate oxidase|nr:L-aspartate oxidase [Bacillales bacterium]
MTSADIIIVGSGLAAWMVARNIANNKKVVMITKKTIYDSNSILAQGGIAVPISENDNWKSHLEDTLKAGGYINDSVVSCDIIRNSKQEIERLIEEGMQFDKDTNGEFNLGLEGAHSSRRILHAGGDATGKSIMNFLFESKPSNLSIVENTSVLDLIVDKGKCVGVVTKNTITEKIDLYFSSHIVLATGGIGSIYSFTSNDSSTTGDGLAIALRAGVNVQDLEFIQFHPTLLYNNCKTLGLISEAVRGEGARIVDELSNEIMVDVHPLGSLAPRDIVAREIYKNIKLGKKVFLDINEVNKFEDKFPTITKMLNDNGINYKNGLLRIVPGAHFHMGGIKTDMNSKTSIDRLYAVGEVACTGFHGANRLASNSLLECIVQGAKLGKYLNDYECEIITTFTPEISNGFIPNKLPSYTEITEKVMENLGILRNGEELLNFIKWIEDYKPFDKTSYSISNESWEIRNILQVSYWIAVSAYARKTSIGAHFIENIESMCDLKVHHN